MQQSGVVAHDGGSRVSELRSEDASAVAGAVQHAIAETFNPTPQTAPPGFPVGHFIRTVLRVAEEQGIELSRDEILEILEVALRRHASMVIGDQLRDVLAGPFGQQDLPRAPQATP